MILKKLKEATREQHEALETVVNVLERSFTLDSYKELLAKFYRFYAAAEPTLPVAEMLEEGLDMATRLKVPLLERDLKAFGIFESAESEHPYDGFRRPNNVAEAFGAVYVMEGATLGGQVISRHLTVHLGITPENGGSFFNSYGANVGPMWKQFGAAVTAFSERHPARDESIVNFAKETFDSFRRCFEYSAKAVQ